MSCKCDSCIYRAPASAINKCDYILVMGYSRDCEPGDNCTAYKEGKRLELKTCRNVNIIKARSSDENYLDKFTTYFN